MRRFFLLISTSLLVSLVFLQPLSALAQTQRFNPNATIQGGNTFSGIQFSGVGGALAGCLDLGGKISRGINSLFNKAKKASGAEENVPVIDSAAVQLQKEQKTREQCLDGVAYAVAKGLLQQLTNRTLNWVNTGFGGNPFYVRDIDSYLRTVSDQQIDRFLTRIPNQNPIFGNAIRSIVTENITGIQDGLIGAVMDTPEARAYQSFQEDFSNGGWGAFLDPNNNAIDAVFRTADRLYEDIDTQENNIVNELQRNEGFLDMKKCVEYEDTSADQAFVRECQSTPQSQWRGTGCTAAAVEFAQTRIDYPGCLRHETVTPGSAISARVAEVTNTDIRQLEQADEINEVLGAFFDQLLSRLFTFGLGSIGDRKNLGFNGSGLGTNVVLGTNGQPIASGQYGQQVGGSGVLTVDFDISRPQQLHAILQVQYDYLNRIQDARIAMTRIVPTLGALDYCIPGPNPTWPDGLNENADTYFGSLAEVTKETTRLGSLLQSIPLIGALFGGGETHTIAAIDVQLFDKTLGEGVAISDTAFHVGNRSPLFIFERVQERYNEVLDYYEANYTKERVKNAFLAVDPANQAFAGGFVEDAFDETSNLPAYSQNIIASGLEGQYRDSEEETRDAIRELESIRTEVNSIVATAKARYIAQQAAAGTPVVRSCIDQAYIINTNPIIPVPRQESDVPSPFQDPSAEANEHFYSEL